MTSQAGRNPKTLQHMVELAELIGASVIGDRVSLGFPTSHPLYVGRSGHSQIREADALLLVDCDVPWIPSIAKPRADARIISIDQDPLKANMPMHLFPSDILIQASSSEAVPALTFEVRKKMGASETAAASERRNALEEAGRQRRQALTTDADAASSATPILPQWLAHCIGEALGDSDLVLDETVTNADYVSAYIQRSQPNTMFASGGSSLGWALGAALGAKLAAPDRRTVALVGDGAFVYGCPTSALWAADKHNIPFLTVIFNNQTHFATKRAMLGAYPQSVAQETNNFVGMELFPSPEYSLLAESCRAYGEKVEDPGDVAAALRRGIERVDGGTGVGDRRAVTEAVGAMAGWRPEGGPETDSWSGCIVSGRPLSAPSSRWRRRPSWSRGCGRVVVARPDGPHHLVGRGGVEGDTDHP